METGSAVVTAMRTVKPLSLVNGLAKEHDERHAEKHVDKHAEKHVEKHVEKSIVKHDELAELRSDVVIDFVSFGMFIIDEIEYLPPRPPVRDILGGAGAYAALGARLFSPPPDLSRSVGWIVDQGSDFPAGMADLIRSWQTAVVLRQDDSRLTTRGWNGYDSAERRAFRYTTTKKRLTPEDLPPAMLTGRAFHVISSASRCREIVTDLRSRRREAAAALAAAGKLPEGAGSVGRPVIIWEPVPDRCTPDELLDCTNTLPLVDVCSPNHTELAMYMGDPDKGQDPVTGAISKVAVERACEQLLSSMPLQSYSLVIRAAEHGCYIAKNGGRRRPRGGDDEKASKPKPKKLAQNLHGGLRHDVDMEALFAGLQQDDEGMIAREEIEVDPGIETWVPAVFGPDDPNHEKAVVDPTGGGNAFTGGMAVALARGRSLEEAAVWGNIAASYAIEQVGVPVLGHDPVTGQETWNGVSVDDRLAAYEARVRKQGALRG